MAKHQPLTKLLGQLVSIDPVLEMAGAHKWSPPMIEAHKASELAKAPPQSKLWHLRYVIDGTILCLAFGTFVALVVCFIGAIGVAMSYGLGFLGMPEMSESRFDNSASLVVYGFWCFVMCVIPCGSLLTIFDNRKIYGPAKWKTYTVKAYEAKYGAMPELGGKIAAHVDTFAPDFTCRVQVLEQADRILDPILDVVSPAGAVRSVLVWDGDTITQPH